MKKKLGLIALATISALFFAASPADADRSASGWNNAPGAVQGVGMYGATFVENMISIYPSFASGRNSNPKGGNAIDFVCESASDSKCLNAEQYATAHMIIPPCSVDSTSMCIEGLKAGKENLLKEAKFERLVTSKNVTGDLAKKIPNGYNQSLWDVSGQKYSVYVLYKSSLAGQILDFQAHVNSYKESKDSRYQEQTVANEPISDGGQRIVGSNGDFGCVWIEKGLCGLPTNIEDGTRIELSIRVYDGLAGWLSGRLKNPDISIKDATNGLKQLVVSGEAVNVQKAFAAVKTAEAPAEIKSEVYYTGITDNQHYLFSSTANDSKSIEFFNVWNKYWPANAESVRTYWGFTRLPGTSSPCLNDSSRVVGLVTTNAMVYDGRPPQFIDSEIQYRVASVHNDENGKQFQGVYDLVIDSKVARCLYNYSSAPISASVSITSSDGNQNVATTLINEKNGWFHMGAYGFHYSSPTIKVKLTQEKLVEVTKPSPSPTSATSANLKKSITCLKGNTKKVVTGMNPKCPVGYKKK